MLVGRQLAVAGIEKVTLESTSDYLADLVYLFEAAGLDVQLVNAVPGSNLPGLVPRPGWTMAGPADRERDAPPVVRAPAEVRAAVMPGPYHRTW